MSSVKDLLKEAKTELAREDYEEAIRVSKQVLKLDESNYFAQVFLGKSYSCLEGKARDAVDHYKAAIELSPDNLLAWKGLVLFLNSPGVVPDVVSYDEYFNLNGEYARLLLQQEQSQVDLIHNIRIFLKKNPGSRESFLWHMIPGSPMAERFAHHFIKPQEALGELISILDANQKVHISKIVSRERLKLSAQDPEYQLKMNSLAWDIYKDSKIEFLYNQLINITDDDDLRANSESSWLEYRILVLKSMPKELKSSYFLDVKRMVDDMVLVDHRSPLAWRLFFEWQDYADLDKMDQQLILKFFKKFPIEPLAIILYAWLSSSFSNYDIKKLGESSNRVLEQDDAKDLADIDEGEKNALNEMMEQENETPGLLEEEVVDALIENISKAQNSILANRVVSQYYVYSREYEAALPYVKAGISVIAYKIRDLGGMFANSKKQFTLSLAILYTYIDAPKNHNAAMSLFEKVLIDDPENTHAKLGKGLIFVEREEWTKANILLNEVALEFPENMEVLSELGWNEAQLGNLEHALSIFEKVLKHIVGTDLRAVEFRALNIWRKAKVHIMIEEQQPTEGQENVKLAFKQLVSSIKILDTFSPSFSTLGDIYSTFFSDKARAFKCYYKAFELDAGDIVAAKYMSENYADLCNWQAASTVAKRLLSSEKAKRKSKEVNWAYRVVGIFYLETQEEASSIEWFQSALRVDPEDIESWVGLGQAYYACGRIEASLKVFDRALELDSEHLYCRYLKAQSLAALGEYHVSIQILENVTALAPTEEMYQVALAGALVSYALDLYSQGLLKKAMSVADEIIKVLRYATTELQCHAQNVWLALMKTLKLYVLVASEVDKLPIESLVSICESAKISYSTNELNDLDEVSLETLLSGTDDSNMSIACKFLILSSKFAVSTADFDNLSRTVRSSLWYNIGSAETTAYNVLKETKYRDAAITSYKKSIHYQSNTPDSWIGLGLATMNVNYRVAQHCFIKASALAPKEMDVWFNLAVLALKNNDVEFAREVLRKSQSLAPQNSSPWLGIALINEREGDLKESYRMFGHAFVLSNGRSKAAQLLYAKSVLQHRIGSSSDERDLEVIEELTAAAYGLDQYFKENPDDSFALQCALLIFERLRIFPKAQDVALKLATALEAKFEKAQDDKDLYNYAIIKSQTARINLGFGNFQAAIDDANVSQSVLTDFNEEGKSALILSNHLSLGLAYFFSDNFDETLEQLQVLLKLSKDSRHLIVLTAKILYEVGSDDAKEIALEELMEYVGTNGADLLVSFTIAAISILEDRKDDLKSILANFSELSLSDLVADKHRDAPYLIEQIKSRLGVEPDMVSPWQRASYFFMNDYKTWSSVNKRIKLRVATDGQNRVTAQQLSESYCSQKNLRSIQRSLFLSPTNPAALLSLKQCF